MCGKSQGPPSNGESLDRFLMAKLASNCIVLFKYITIIASNLKCTTMCDDLSLNKLLNLKTLHCVLRLS